MKEMLRDNWFLVVPTFILGLVALFALNRAYSRADVRRAQEVVRTYRAEGRAPLGEVVMRRHPEASWSVEERSSWYGTFDVLCRRGEGGELLYRWRVDVLQRAFAPATPETTSLMQEYDPEIFAGDGGSEGASTTEEERRREM